MSKPFQWSFSKLRDWETCSLMYYEKYVVKSIKDDSSVASKWGDTVHEALEKRAIGKPLPETLAPLERIGKAIDRAKSAGIQVYADKESGKWAFDRDLHTVDWYAKTVYGRVIVDLALIGERHGVLVDYKTGKRKNDETQLKISAAVGFARFQQVQTLETRFVWTQGGAPTVSSYDRSDAPWMWNEILPRIDRMETGIMRKQFDPRPSGFCGWCVVRTCPHNTNEKK